ncbi:MAG: glycosyltransferase [Methanomassiliicoccales archaeon]|nr:MAG: glycosyltransferase [Methanomassiliicoccales archaeon]
MKKKVLMLLSNEYRPDPRVYKEAAKLQAIGKNVTILCWNRRLEKEPITIDDSGAKIKRLNTIKTTHKIILPIGLFCFYLKAILHGLRERPDVVHAHDLDTLFPGLMISKIGRAHLVYDAHEHYSHMVSVDIGEKLSFFFDFIESLMVKRAGTVIAANDAIASYLKSHTEEEITVIMNCIENPGIHRFEVINGPTIFYGGSLEPGRYIEETIDVVQQTPWLKMKIAGDGRLKEYVINSAKKCDRITFQGYVSHNDLLREMASSTGILALLDPKIPNNIIGTPNRIFEAMAIGVPILASKGTLAGEIVKSAEAGLVIDMDKENLIGAITVLSQESERNRLGDNGIKAYVTKYNWQIMGDRLAYLYDKIK